MKESFVPRGKTRRAIKQTVAYLKESHRAVRRNVDLAASAQRVISARIKSTDTNEAMRLFPEKATAFSDAWMMFLPQAVQIALRFGPSTRIWSSLWTAQNPWQFWQRSLGYTVPLTTALLQAQGAMVTTLQDTVSRNQRRLSGRSTNNMTQDR
jgi:hypothetical protein